MIFSFSVTDLFDRLTQVGMAPKWLQPCGNAEVVVGRISTDTRTIESGDLFVTLKGERFNANDYVVQALKQGAVAAVVDEERPEFSDLQQPVILVADALEALAQIALWQREAFTGPVVSITGSAGKTSTKQLMASVLSQVFNTWMTQGNLNNHIGVPLTLLGLQPEHQAAVVELGASGLREIADIARLALPRVGVITNAAAAHLEGFGSLQGVIETKGELIDFVQEGGCMVLNADDAAFPQWLERARSRDLPVKRFGIRQAADVTARDIQLQLTGSTFVLDIEGETARVQLPLAGEHNVMNALAVSAAAHALGLPIQNIVDGLEKSSAVVGRMQSRRGRNGQTVIDDSYNANPASFLAAINVISDSPNAWLVMGDMAELGEGALKAHEEVGRVAKTRGIAVLAATGAMSRTAVDAFGDSGYWFANQELLTDFIKNNAPDQSVILVKGSRSAAMDKVVKVLCEDSGEN